MVHAYSREKSASLDSPLALGFPPKPRVSLQPCNSASCCHHTNPRLPICPRESTTSLFGDCIFLTPAVRTIFCPHPRAKIEYRLHDRAGWASICDTLFSVWNNLQCFHVFSYSQVLTFHPPSITPSMESYTPSNSSVL